MSSYFFILQHLMLLLWVKHVLLISEDDFILLFCTFHSSPQSFWKWDARVLELLEFLNTTQTAGNTGHFGKCLFLPRSNVTCMSVSSCQLGSLGLRCTNHDVLLEFTSFHWSKNSKCAFAKETIYSRHERESQWISWFHSQFLCIKCCPIEMYTVEFFYVATSYTNRMSHHAFGLCELDTAVGLSVFFISLTWTGNVDTFENVTLMCENQISFAEFVEIVA